MGKSRVARRAAIVLSFIMLIVSAVNTTYGYIVTLTDPIVNVFEPEEQEPEKPNKDSVSVNIGIEKTVKNTGAIDRSPEGFEFVLKNTDTGAKRSVTSDVDGNARFVLRYDEDDVGKTYTYKVYELDEGAKGITYDTREYTVSITVKRTVTGSLVAVKELDGVKVSTLTVSFENIYHNDGDSSPDTYDGSKMSFWLVSFVLSGSVFTSLLIYEKKYARR